MKKMSLGLLLGLVYGFLFSTAVAADVKLKVEKIPFEGYEKAVVTSKEEQISVKNVIVNRSNCRQIGVIPWEDGTPENKKRYKPGERLGPMTILAPFQLKFGERFEVPTFCRELLEINIITDKGEFTYEFE